MNILVLVLVLCLCLSHKCEPGLSDHLTKIPIGSSFSQIAISESSRLKLTSRVVAYERFHCTVFFNYETELAALIACFVSFTLKLVRNPTTDHMLKEGPIQQRYRREGLGSMLTTNMQKYAEDN